MLARSRTYRVPNNLFIRVNTTHWGILHCYCCFAAAGGGTGGGGGGGGGGATSTAAGAVLLTN